MSGRERIHRPDDLAAARGLGMALLLCVPVWAVAIYVYQNWSALTGWLS